MKCAHSPAVGGSLKPIGVGLFSGKTFFKCAACGLIVKTEEVKTGIAPTRGWCRKLL